MNPNSFDCFTEEPRYAVLQAGARMHYAVPALLERAGLLQAFYTDVHANHFPLQLLKKLLPRKLQPKSVRRLLGRQIPNNLPLSKVRDQPMRSLAAPFLNSLFPSAAIDPEKAVLRRAERDQFAGATALYTNFINSDLELIEKAKEAGLYCVHELIIGADVGRILIEEQSYYRDVEPEGDPSSVVEAGITRDMQKWDLVDRILVPSQYCFDSSVSLGADPNKIIQVPYGISEDWFNLIPEPKRGRVLFVGQVGLRKGSHYLAAATRQLRQHNPDISVRVAGPLLVSVDTPLFGGPIYLNQVPRSQIQDEFRRADVFVLPTLADSFGLVHLEAMACGVPVITTPHCGSVIRDGVEGFIVPIRDSQMLAERIDQLVSDRELRKQMSEAARNRAKEFTWQKYGERLLSALQY